MLVLKAIRMRKVKEIKVGKEYEKIFQYNELPKREKVLLKGT